MDLDFLQSHGSSLPPPALDDLTAATTVIMTLAAMIEGRDGYREGHCSRMANVAVGMGRALGLGEPDLQALYLGGYLHDIGMLAVPESVLAKAEPLTAAEFDRVKSHTIVGDRLCSDLRSLQAARPIVRSHHERLDGSGYPDGLGGSDVPLLAQIVGVVDAYEAITTRRPYQAALSSNDAIAVLRTHVERGYRQQDIVETFAALAVTTFAQL
jgi:putative two-component system response regulator